MAGRVRWAERQVRRVVHLYARFTRGFAIRVEAAVAGPGGTLMLVRAASGDGWVLPSADIGVGESATDALLRALAAAGVAPKETPRLLAIDCDPQTDPRRQTCLYEVTDFATTDAVPTPSDTRLFAPPGDWAALAGAAPAERLARLLHGARRDAGRGP